MCEHYTPETLAARLAKILADPLYGAAWPSPPQNEADQSRANRQMSDWYLVNLALCSSGAKTGIARIYEYDGVTSGAAWDKLTTAYREHFKHDPSVELLRPIYRWLHSANRITVAGAKRWNGVKAPLVMIDRRVFINSPRAPHDEEHFSAQIHAHLTTAWQSEEKQQ